jgi:hypothetical protein
MKGLATAATALAFGAGIVAGFVTGNPEPTITIGMFGFVTTVFVAVMDLKPTKVSRPRSRPQGYS